MSSKKATFLCLAVVILSGLWLVARNHSFVQKIKYFGKPLAKTRPKNLLNGDQKLADLIPDPVDKKKVKLHIVKSKYLLVLGYDGKPVKGYPIVLGSDAVHDKIKEGDGCTPEGIFRIKKLYHHRTWSRFMWLDYPNSDSWRKHNEAITQGIISACAGIGGEIGIHGVPEGDDNLIDRGVNWTAGCISLKRKDVKELFDYCQRGTEVEIRHRASSGILSRAEKGGW